MICMICNTPTKLQHSSEGCNTPVWAETTSSSGFSSHCVLTTLLTSFQGMCVPEAEGEPDPKASPSPHPLLGGRGCFGERGPRSHCCGQHRLFRPHVARREGVTEGEEGEIRPLLSWLYGDVHPQPCSCPGCWTATRTVCSVALSPAESGGKEQEGVLPSALQPQEDTKVWGG